MARKQVSYLIFYFIFLSAVVFPSCGSYYPPPATAGNNIEGAHVLNEGWHEISKITVNNVDYYLILIKSIDSDPQRPMYSLLVIKGSWQVAKPYIIAEPGHPLEESQWVKTPPKDYLMDAVAAINTDLERAFTPAPMPTTWSESFEIEAQYLKMETDGQKIIVR
jgi:hypothetical protein